jgi:phosphoserine/homoserine phosphotransferase
VPLDGAKQFSDQLRADYPADCLSDTFPGTEPMIRQLDWPTIFCHELVIDDQGRINYKLRKPDKRETVKRLQRVKLQRGRRR